MESGVPGSTRVANARVTAGLHVGLHGAFWGRKDRSALSDPGSPVQHCSHGALGCPEVLPGVHKQDARDKPGDVKQKPRADVFPSSWQ